MDEKEMVWIASIAIAKRLDYEELMYSDYMYGNTDLMDDVWEYVEEATNIGMDNFAEKYSNYKIYGR